MNRLTGVLVFLSAATASPSFAAQINRESFGCRSLASTEHLMAMRHAGDQTSYRDRLGKLLRAGECRLWMTGDQVSSEDESETLACLALKGARGLCYWSAKAVTE